MTTPPNILVWGANSAICREVLKLYSARQSRLFLVARDADKLAATAADLAVRGAVVSGTATVDFNRVEALEKITTEAAETLGHLDIIFVAHGSLPDQALCESDPAALETCMNDNFSSAALIAQGAAQQLASQGGGTLAVISSVAGDRGRKSNYAYGAAKAGVNALMQGLQGRFAGTGIHMVTIKPGMIKTPMTAGMGGGLLWSTPAVIAPAIVRAIDKGKRVAYVPGYWRVVMWLIKALPTAVLARLPI